MIFCDCTDADLLVSAWVGAFSVIIIHMIMLICQRLVTCAPHYNRGTETVSTSEDNKVVEWLA